MNTVGELKNFIKDLDDDIPLIKRSNNFELGGAVDIGIYPIVEKFKTEIREFLDAFDYETYYHEVYINDEKGVDCLQIC